MRYNEFNETDQPNEQNRYKPHKPIEQYSLGALQDEVQHIAHELPEPVDRADQIYRRKMLILINDMIKKQKQALADKKPAGQEETDLFNRHIYDGDIAEKIAAYLWKNCRPYVEAIDYNLQNIALFRGMTTSHAAPFNIHKVRLRGRKPKDTSKRAHKALNDYFIKEFGEPFRNAVFTSGDIEQASVYLDDYDQKARAIFPIGDFTFCWSPDVQDLYMDVLDQPDTWVNGNIEDTIPTLGYRQGDLQVAIDSDSEVMVRCKQYVSVHYELLFDVEYKMRDMISQELKL